MTTKQIRDTRQAIANLEMAIKTLKEDGATKAAIKPYATNLAREQVKLKKQLRRRWLGGRCNNHPGNPGG